MNELLDLRSRSLAIVFSAAAALVTWAAGCSTYDDRIGYVAPPPSPTQLAPNGGVDASTEAGGEDLCAATECPAPYTTCSDSKFRCDKNLDSDNLNCGGCGVVCPGGDNTQVEDTLHADWRCSSGACRMSCMQDFADCNGSPGDGCEVDTNCDPNNCGGCGIKCAEGVDCIYGKCGCAAGMTECFPPSCTSFDRGACRDLQTDDDHCGACGAGCPQPDDLPPHTYSGCNGGACGHLKCEPGWENCDAKMQPNGCEVEIATDPNNCGACGFQCAAGQQCHDGQCICAPGAHRCEVELGDGRTEPYCAYVDVDPFNCGACGHECPNARIDKSDPLRGNGVCRYGQCVLECPAGRADCDNNWRTSCETSTDSDPNNCGGCGIQCDIAAGQPCIRGQCALAPCPERPVQ